MILARIACLEIIGGDKNARGEKTWFASKSDEHGA